MSTILDKRTAVRVTNTTESPYLKKSTQTTEFSTVNTEQFKRIIPVNMANFSIIPESDPNLTTYLIEILPTNNPKTAKQHGLTRTQESPGKTENHTTMHSN